MAAKLKIEKRGDEILIVHCCFSISQNKGTHPGTIPARFGLIWFSGFRGEDLNVIVYQNTDKVVLLFIYITIILKR
jgi:hypothetical protein